VVTITHAIKKMAASVDHAATLTTKILQLEEENRALLKENSVLRESLLLLGGEYGVHEGSGRAKDTTSSLKKSDSAEGLFITAMNAMVKLTRQLVRDDAKGKTEEGTTMTPQERLRDSLKHVFVDSCHIMCESVINCQGFWCRSSVSSVYPAHPMCWLLNNFPVEEDSPLGWFPLHWCALSNSSDLIDINALHSHYSADPKLRLQLHQKMSALTMSVSKPQPNVEIVQALVELDPMVVRAKSSTDGSLPIMHALSNNDDNSSIRLLHGLYPDCVRETDTHGNRAINYACKWGSDDAVKFILSVDSRSAHYRGNTGNTALHDVCHNTSSRHSYSENEEKGLSIDTVMELFHANTEAIKLPNAEGALPLHLASKSASLSLVQLLHGLYPSAVSVADNEGLCPIDYAASRPDKDEGQIGQEVLSYLLQARGVSGE
jgi:hypothetical protein